MHYVPPRAPSCAASPQPSRIGISVNRDELTLIVESVRTAMSFYFDSYTAHVKAGEEEHAAYARDQHDDCAAMLNWLATVDDTARGKVT